MLKKARFLKHKANIDYLKTEYGLTYGYANLVVLKSREADDGQPRSGGSLIDQQYSGCKIDLRQIYDAIIEAVKGL